MTEKWLSKKQFAQLVGVSVSTLNRWLADDKNPIPQGARFGSGPKPIRRWKESEVIEYMDQQNAA